MKNLLINSFLLIVMSTIGSSATSVTPSNIGLDANTPFSVHTAPTQTVGAASR